ncbi:MAG: DUF2911 domain-containing protein [Cyclobacteriaceae bacterium]|nr:DUF2911 domain-containing protein [Cyclobacteriaceae bacterium]
MIARTLSILSFIVLAACGNVKKDEAANVINEPKVTEVPTPGGIIINAQSELDTLKGSPKAYAVGKIGTATFTINYYSPATRGRMIWGGLVAYDNVWVTGAHKSTSIEFDHDIKIGETVVTAGKYAFFTIPGKSQWTIILNKNWNQHLADDYAQAEDVVRLSVVPETEEKHQERLRYVIEAEGENAGEIRGVNTF